MAISCGLISAVFFSIVLLCMSSVMIIIIILNFTCFLFVNKRINNFSSSLTVVLSVLGHITRDVSISFHQFKSSGFFHSLLLILGCKLFPKVKATPLGIFFFFFSLGHWVLRSEKNTWSHSRGTYNFSNYRKTKMADFQP